MRIAFHYKPCCSLAHCAARCENEARICTQSTQSDSSFEDLKKQWHASCDTKVSLSVTTAPLESITVGSGLEAACETIAPSCLEGVDIMSKCTQSYSNTDFLSCACEGRVTSLRSVCSVDGNVSCLATSGDIASVYGYSACLQYSKVGMNLGTFEEKELLNPSGTG